MLKIVASLVIFGLCANVCFATFGVAPTSSSQSGAISSSALNTTYTKVYSAANTTDAAKWDASGTAVTAPATGVDASGVIFGPGTTNTTSYVYGIVYGATPFPIASIVKRTLNATVVSWANDTTEASVAATDTTITVGAATTSGAFQSAVGPGYLALLTTGSDGGTPANQQIYVTLVSGSTGTPGKITSTSDVTTTCTGSSSTTTTATTFTLGNIWYDIGSGAFFYTYTKKVISTPCTAGTAGTATTAYTIYLGGIFVNGTAYFSSQLSITPTTATHAVTNLMGGGDNWLSSSNIYVTYKDATAGTVTTYLSKTAKSTNTTTAGTFSSLVADTTGTPAMTYLPIGVWASNYTYGVAVSNKTVPASGSTTYTITNYLNGSTTGTDSGLSYSSATASAVALKGWQLTTGYTLVGTWGATSPANALILGNFYANGTANSSQVTLSSGVAYSVNTYEDVNGTNWIGWTDYDTSANTDQNSAPYTYAGYLAILQGQLNAASSSSANVLATLSAFVLFLASIFVF